MAELKRRTRWKKWAPDVGENRDLPGGPVLFLELQVDLTAQQLTDFGEALSEGFAREVEKPMRERIVEVYDAALSQHVRVHGGPHTVDGMRLESFRDYLEIITQSASLGLEQLKELMAALTAFNSLGGADELFSLRRSGGARSTDARSNE